MKKTILYIGILVLVLNVAIGLLLSAYPLFNHYIANMALIKQQSAYSLAVSLTFLYSFLGIIQLVLGIFSPARITDNWMIVTIIALLVLECTLLIVTKTISKKVK